MPVCRSIKQRICSYSFINLDLSSKQNFSKVLWSIFSGKSLILQELASFTAELRAKPEHHRFLIGRGGTNIRKVREKTGARIVFPSAKDDDKELITIIGKKEAVEAAKQDLMKAIKERP